MPFRPRVRRFVRSGLLAGALAMSLGGCGNGCGGDGASSNGSGSTAAVEAPSFDLAAALPADATSVVLVRHWGHLASFYEALRPRLAGLTDLGVIETDLRNTVGFDILHPAETLGDIGVAYPGGLGAIIEADGKAWLLLSLSDAARFTEHASEVLSEEPFSLVAAPAGASVNGANVLQFKSGDAGPVQVTIVVGDTWAAFLPDWADATFAERVVARVQAGGLSTQPAFAAALAEAGESPIVAWGSGARLLEVVSAAGAAGLPSEQLEALTSLVVRLDADADSLDATVQVAVTERAATQFAQVLTGAGTAPGFDRLTVDSTYAFARLTVDPVAALALWRGEMSEGLRARTDARIAEIDRTIGMSFVEGLLPALGHSAFLMATETRMLTLRRAMQDPAAAPGDLFAGLGLALGIHIEDRARIETLAQTLVAASDGRATRFEEAGNTVIEFNDAQIDVGAVVITDGFVLLVPARDREDFIAALSAGGSGRDFGSPVATSLLNELTANGLFIDLRAVLTGPLGAFATEGMPGPWRTVLNQLVALSTTVAPSPTGLTFSTSLTFGDSVAVPEPVPAPAPTPAAPVPTEGSAAAPVVTP